MLQSPCGHRLPIPIYETSVRENFVTHHQLGLQCKAASKFLILKKSPVHTVAENGDCRRKVRLSQKTATVALFCDSRRLRRQIVAEIGDYTVASVDSS